MSFRQQFVVVCLAVAVMIAGTVPAFAQMIRVSEFDSAVGSDAAVVGHVVDVRAAWDNDAIYTYTTVEVMETLKGGVVGRIVIREMGG